MKHAVLGATGGIGSAVVENILSRHETVRVLVRNPAKAARWTSNPLVEVVIGDALSAEDVEKTVMGCGCVYHCVNIPYNEWEAKAFPMLENTIAAAQAAGARILFPGNVYVFGHAKTRLVSEDHPFEPHTRKGKLRVRMEYALRDAWKNNRVPFVIVRFPDFYGPRVDNRLYGPIFRNGLSGKSLRWYGKLDVPIEFSYVEDAAEALAKVAATPGTSGNTYHLPGPGITTPSEWLGQVATIANSGSRPRSTPKFLVSLIGLFNPLAREFSEMLYLKEERLILDGAKFKAEFGSLPATPYEDGIRKTLDWFRQN